MPVFVVRVNTLACAPLFILVCLFGLSAQALAQNGPASAARSNPLSVVFEPKELATLSAEVPGRILRVEKKMGGSFDQGAALVELEPTIYEANLLKAKAAVTATSKALQVTKKMRGYESASVLDLADARKEALTAQAGRRIAARELELTKVTAPFPGVVKQVLARRYEWVDKGDPVMEVFNDDVLLAKILMPAGAFGKLKIGDVISIAVNETNNTVKSRITNVGRVLDPASGTFEVEGEVENTDGAVKGGMTGTVLTESN